MPGWNGNLDLDKFYGDAGQWELYASGGKKVEAASPEPAGTVTLENEKYRVDITEKQVYHAR